MLPYPSSFWKPAENPTRPENVDWSQLPDRFRHLINFFESYGYFQFESVIMDKLKSMNKDELSYINNMYDIINPISDDLHTWIDSVGLTKSKAAALVYFSLLFLGMASYYGFIKSKI
jgi:regulator of sigma D